MMGKLFVNGISGEATEEELEEYFRWYGEITETGIIRDGYGFVCFAEPTVLNNVFGDDPHTIKGHTVSLSREEQQTSAQSGNPTAERIGGGGGCGGSTEKDWPANIFGYGFQKIFVYGIPRTLCGVRLAQYFQKYGKVTRVVMLKNKIFGSFCGMGSVTFQEENSASEVMKEHFHAVDGDLLKVESLQFDLDLTIRDDSCFVAVEIPLPKDLHPTTGCGCGCGYDCGICPGGRAYANPTRPRKKQTSAGSVCAHCGGSGMAGSVDTYGRIGSRYRAAQRATQFMKFPYNLLFLRPILMDFSEFY